MGKDRNILKALHSFLLPVIVNLQVRKYTELIQFTAKELPILCLPSSFECFVSYCKKVCLKNTVEAHRPTYSVPIHVILKHHDEN